MSKNLAVPLSAYRHHFQKAVSLVQANPKPAWSVAALIAAIWVLNLVSPHLGAPWGLQGLQGSLVILALAALLLGYLAWVGLAIGQDFGSEAPTWRSWGGLMARWALLSLQLFLRGALITSPAWLPIFFIGIADALNHGPKAPSPWFSGYFSIAYSVLASVVGYFYLWSYPAMLISPDVSVSEVQQWSQRLSARTWPLAVLFLALALLMTLAEGTGRTYELLQTGALTLQLVFVMLQAYLLFDAAKRPGFAP